MPLTRHIINGFRYQVAVNEHGRNALVEVLKWTYKGGSLSVKKYFETQGGTNKKFKEIFNAEQRNILNKETPYLLNVDATFKEYDLSLLYTILRNFCGLEGPNSDAWKNPASGKKLEYLICRLKQERNDIAHIKVIKELTDREIIKKLKWLKCLLSRIIRTSGTISRKQPHIPRTLIQGIKQEFKQILTKVLEPLDRDDHSLLPQLRKELMKFRNIIEEKIKEDSCIELRKLYPDLWDVTLAKWLYPDLTVRPSLNFTNLIIKEDTTRSLPFDTHPRTISHEDILQVRRSNGDLPEVLIISGEGGMGKTTLLKFLLETWVEHPKQIKGLENISHLMYFQLRGSNISNLRDLLKILLPNTFKETGVKIEYFEDFFLNFSIIFLLDGYDEANENSKKLVNDLLKFQRNNIRFVITTRPGCLSDLIPITEQRKKVMNIEIKGIQRKDRMSFVERTLSVIEPKPDHIDALKVNIIANLDTLQMDLDELDIPLTITLVIIRELKNPTERTTDIYEDLTVLMMGKITDRLAVQEYSDAANKVKKYFSTLKKVSLRGLKRKEHDLWPDTLQELEDACEKLEVPHIDMLSGFFSSKRTWNGASYEQTWSFPHNKFQEHWAAGFIVTQFSDWRMEEIREPNKEDVVGCIQNHPFIKLFFEDSEEAGQFFKNSESDREDMFIDLMCKVVSISMKSQKTLLWAFTNLLLYSKCSRPVKRKKCDKLCRLLRASGNATNMLEMVIVALQDIDDTDILGSFYKEIVALTDLLRPQHVIRPTEDEPEGDHICDVDSALHQLVKRNVEIVTQEKLEDETVPKLLHFAQNAFDTVKKMMDSETASEGIHELVSSLPKLLDAFK
ncbi:uncharacterized protein LOC125040017 [Penaeus chinensis]|uniref:uncharacterized protein LOC125040017 n=1 Tax=Penaeus chinensis TaxID=139456 RepID=UPI001FB64E84|nr:uncharacterized protein LOC125040017 [Penaeus chinensis]